MGYTFFVTRVANAIVTCLLSWVLRNASRPHEDVTTTTPCVTQALVIIREVGREIRSERVTGRQCSAISAAVVVIPDYLN